jgi:hypothetical protein
MSGRRIDVSATQVVASLLATVTGAVAASYLGVAGTLIGAAIGSVASTAGTSLYRHYLARSQERLRKAAVVLAPRAGLSGIARHPGQERVAGEPAQESRLPGRGAGERTAGAAGSAGAVGDWARTAGGVVRTASDSAAQARPSSPDYQATEAFPRIGDHPPGWPLDGDQGPTEVYRGLYGHPSPGPARDPAETSRDSAVTAGTTRDTAAPARASRDSAAPARTSRDTVTTAGTTGTVGTAGTTRGKRRWIVLAGVALAVFVFAMGAITAFEVAAGKPLTSVLRNQRGSGTTFGNAVNGHGSQPSSPAKTRPTTHPTTGTATGTPSQSPTPSPSLTPSLAPDPTPTTSPSSPANASPSPSGAAS